MSLWNTLTSQFIDVIEWLDSSNDTLVWRFERHGNEIKYGAKLTVREGQTAVFVNEGRLADIYPPGLYKLETRNMPILTTLMSWDHGFNSPFKAEVYFISTRQFTDLKWGTKNPVMLRDPEFGPVRLRAFGSYAMRVADPAKFLREVVGTDGWFTTGEISNQLRNLIVSRFATALGQSDAPVLDLAARYDQLGAYLASKIAPDVGAYGVELTSFLVENVSLPPAVEQALDRRTSMGVIGDLDRYMKFQSAEALRAAAEAPGGAAGASVGAGVGAGLGLALGGQLAGAAGPWGPRPAAPAPAAVSAPVSAPTLAPTLAGAAPPNAAPAAFWLAVDGARAGPFDLATLKARALAGGLTSATLVWRAGMAGWTRADQVAEVAALFRGSEPPPLPPPLPPAG